MTSQASHLAQIRGHNATRSPVMWSSKEFRKREKAKVGTPAGDWRSTPPQGVVHPMFSGYERGARLPRCWYEYTNFFGRSYFYNDYLRVCTNEDMHDQRLRDELYAKVYQSNTWSQQDIGRRWHFPADAQHLLFFHRNNEDLFLTGVTISCASGGVFQFHGDDEYYGQHELWAFLLHYPMHYTVIPPFVEVQFLCAVAYEASERASLGDSTTFPYTNEEWETVMNIYNDLKARQAGPDGDYVVPAIIWHMARTMRDIWLSRGSRNFGTRRVLISRDDIRLTSPRTRNDRLLSFAMGVLFLGMHTTYLERLRGVVLADHLMCAREFKKLLDALLAEWGESNLLAAVFLAANIGFLAVNDVDSIQRTASLASSLFAVSSLAAGVHHVWLHKSKNDITYLQIHAYVNHKMFSFSLQTNYTITACFLSIPTAALLWSIISFSAFLAMYSIQESSEIDGALLTALLGVVAFCIMGALFFFWHVWRDGVDAMKGRDVSGVKHLNNRSENASVISSWYNNTSTKLKDGIRLRFKKPNTDAEGQ
ncbi:hypothetical protein BV22DRAFT_1131320 [Leucogyrophana mollusca]|uniref:Uncharacterized protein n=1 Tax=Leucogyrophana mollusca TaxID=85980 RepID=A0ACB8BAD8_9AGAM|nr:hypothetical protein BV22DRAFT_1131320 [Leucogyrophana mollusca]